VSKGLPQEGRKSAGKLRYLFACWGFLYRLDYQRNLGELSGFGRERHLLGDKQRSGLISGKEGKQPRNKKKSVKKEKLNRGNDGESQGTENKS